jgi:hypothetical protein
MAPDPRSRQIKDLTARGSLSKKASLGRRSYMAWPSLFLFISLGGFFVALVGALALQFFREPPRGTAWTVAVGLVFGMSSIALYLTEMRVAEDTDKRASLVQLLLK